MEKLIKLRPILGLIMLTCIASLMLWAAQYDETAGEVAGKTNMNASQNVKKETSAPKTFKATVSQYSKIETCPNRACVTASGKIAKAGVSVACPRAIKLGTKVKLNGVEYTCHDRTSQKYNGRFDVYAGDSVSDYYAALAYGLGL